jgi:hypothetical protein
MSLENVIAEHAAALNNLAAALREAFGPVMLTAIRGTSQADAALDEIPGEKSRDGDAKTEAENKAAADEAKAKAAADKKAKADAKAKKDAADKAAADAAAASAASSQTAGADSSDDGLGDDSGDGLGEDEPVPDYKTEVRPALLDAIKRTDKATVLEKCVKAYGVAKAEDLDPSVYREVMAKAKALGV